uniref:DNA-directed RNA polymerase subunit beta' n=1 Tax=Ephedra somalensis TaxID=288821 RepID=A0A8F4TIZ4_9SPER|nr:RNA polymerase beta' subunit [Ephedra somalensis]QXG18283.1 RNA polymerase beta' subunit [Ephedra somalensis]
MIDSKKKHQKLRITLVSPEQIRAWCEKTLPNGEKVGQVLNPRTIDLVTNKPKRNGLFCERIFGPVKNGVCACEKKPGEEKKGFPFGDRKKKKTSICEHCGVELVDSRVRRYRMGYIQLVCPVTHIWYFKRIPSYIAMLIGKKNSEIKDLVYCKIYPNIFLARPTTNRPTISRFRGLLQHEDIPSWMDFIVPYISGWNFVEFQEREIAIGGNAIQKQLTGLDLRILLDQSYIEWKKLLKNYKIQRGKNKIQQRNHFLSRRIKFAKYLIQAKIQPEWMVLCLLPVLPPELRPIFALGQQMVVESDLNKLYQKVLIRNKNLQTSFEMQGGPFYSTGDFLTLQKRLLQEAVDALLDNDRTVGQPRNFHNRPYKSFSDVIAGKEGRFRTNLLGKRVDYSGRSVIIVGPSLALHQCGLPREMAIKLFQPFLIRSLIGRGFASNLRAAKNLIQKRKNIVWKILKKVMLGHPVLLNRAPTLHKFGILAFQPILVKEHAIRLHPLVCTGFNADFDGDQMAVHVPLSPEAIVEARLLMFSYTNILSTSHGSPITIPTQDMLLGLYILTVEKPQDIYEIRYHPFQSKEIIFFRKKNTYFLSFNHVFIAFQKKQVQLNNPLWLKWKVANGSILTPTAREVPIEIQYHPKGLSQQIYEHYVTQNDRMEQIICIYIRTTVGRVLFNREIKNAIKTTSKLFESSQTTPAF